MVESGQYEDSDSGVPAWNQLGHCRLVVAALGGVSSELGAGDRLALLTSSGVLPPPNTVHVDKIRAVPSISSAPGSGARSIIDSAF